MREEQIQDGAGRALYERDKVLEQSPKVSFPYPLIVHKQGRLRNLWAR